jgi:hypothetical protein
MCTAVGQDSVLKVSTIPSVGFNARLAMPVLKDLEVMSRIAVPVVSEPVPAVVGTWWLIVSFTRVSVRYTYQQSEGVESLKSPAPSLLGH